MAEQRAFFSEMTPELWQRLKPLFHSALEKEPYERDAFIALACGNDEELRRHLSLLIDGNRESINALDTALADLSTFLDGDLSPGDILAKRYRVVSLIGRGGMGQVYRAEDIKLGQTVALKFLFPEFTSDPAWLSRLLIEVCTAREVTHPNVCRVHDIVETVTPSGSTLHFLTMEYVNGENLSTMTRRVGKLPTEMALTICSQVSAGLAAAHRKGVLHRDIKPGNILLDGRGQAKLADFGLAVPTGLANSATLAGTPGYIAPEIVAGAACNERSDIFALGVVCYELLTGIPPTKVIPKVSDLRKTRPDLSDSTCRVIISCLAPDPLDRPKSASDLLKALPMDDPLEAALARGEIPSPAAVAAAGSDEPLQLWKALIILSVVLVGICGIWYLAPLGTFLGLAHPVLSPLEMKIRGKELLERFGYSSLGSSDTFVLKNNTQMLDFLSFLGNREQKKQLNGIGQGSLILTYRQSVARSLLPTRISNGTAGSEENSFASATDPSPLLPGIRTVDVDSNGHLLRLLANPDTQAWKRFGSLDSMCEGHIEPDWNTMILATGVNSNSAKEVGSVQYGDSASPFAFTARKVWRAYYSGHPEFPLTIEATAWRGCLNWVDVKAPWDESSEERGLPALTNLGVPVLILCSLTMAAFTARYNLRLGRGDTRSAIWLGTLSACLCLIASLTSWQSGVGSIRDRLDWMFLEIESALTVGAGVWLAYIAIEPLARKHVPRLLVSSSKLLQGNWKSPLVGTEILIGCMFGAICPLFYIAVHAYTWPRWTGASLSVAPVMSLAGGQHALYSVIWRLGTLPERVAQYAVLFVVLRIVLGNVWRASFVFFFFMILVPGTHGSIYSALPVYSVLGAFAVLVLARTGLVAAASYMFTLNTIDRCVWPHSWNSWMLSSCLLSIALIFGLAGFGFLIATGAPRSAPWEIAVQKGRARRPLIP